MGDKWDALELLDHCASIATDAHKDQYRRDGLTPYIDHPRSVVRRLTTVDEKCVGWLHDVLEDTNLTAKDLLTAGVPSHIVDGVIYITKRKSESLQEYYVGVKHNALSTKVKIQDMLHNLSDSPTEKQIIKYSKGLLFLLEED